MPANARSKVSRRNFMGSLSGAVLSAASYRRVLGANSRIGLSLVGAGRRGTEVAAAFLEDERVDLRCICDVYDLHRERAAKSLAKSGAVPKTVVAHEDLLAMSEVDTVLIAAPDHLHLTLADAALRSGKHVYLEKPIIHRWEERKALEAAAKRSGRVLQCGTQQRSGKHYIRAKEDIFSQKKLGHIVFARAVWSNFPWQQRHISPAPKPPGLDWERFLGPAPKVPYDTARYDAWRYFPDYGGGVLADILTHWADVAQWMLDDPKPRSAVSLGGIYEYDDGRQNPDTVNAVVQYDKWNLSFESSVLPVRNDRPSVFFQGTEGALDLARDGYVWQPNKGQAVQVSAAGSLERAHTENFINAILGGQPVSANLLSGIQACLPVQMALKSYWSKRLVTIDEWESA
jgi:predicted dehydrogenase